jgi:hypothetical protein
MNMNEMVAQHYKKMEAQKEELMKNPLIAKYVAVCNESYKGKRGRELTLHEQRNLAMCMNNAITESAVHHRSRLFEATTEDDISFLGIQLPVIAALIPSLALNEVANVQAIDRRIAAVFYLDVLYGSSKGGVTSGETMLDAQTGHPESKAARRYAMARVVDESLGTGNGALSGTVDYAPGLINLENVKIEKVSGSTRTTLGTSDSSGNITGDYISGTGSITAAGVYSLTITGVDSTDTIYITYDYQYDLTTDASGDRNGVPKANVQVTQSTVEAIDFPLRAEFSLGAQLDLQKAHGINLENELVKYLGSEIKFTIDQYGLDQIDEAAGATGAAAAITSWNAQIQTGQEWLWKKHEIMDRFEQGSNNIFEKTKRGVATFIIAGNNVARVIKQLPDFKPVSGLDKTPPTGPMKIGDINGRTVVQNPFKNSNEYTMGYKGDNYLMSGFIYAPYIPLFATPTLTTSDLFSQKGFLSSAGFKRINDGLFTKGSITNLGTQAT